MRLMEPNVSEAKPKVAMNELHTSSPSINQYRKPFKATFGALQKADFNFFMSNVIFSIAMVSHPFLITAPVKPTVYILKVQETGFISKKQTPLIGSPKSN